MSAGVWERLCVRPSRNSALVFTVRFFGKRSGANVLRGARSKKQKSVRQCCHRRSSGDPVPPVASVTAKLARESPYKRRRFALVRLHPESASEDFETMTSEGDMSGLERHPTRPVKQQKVNREQAIEQRMMNGRSEEVVKEEDFYLEDVGYVTVTLHRDCLTWHLTESDDDVIGNSCWGRKDTEKSLGQVPIAEVFASQLCEIRSSTSGGTCCFPSASLPQMHRFAVHSFRRSQSNKCNWVPVAHMFCHEDANVCQDWVARIEAILDQDARRPKNLLVLVNPYGGKGSGVQQWDLVKGLFERARVKVKMILTERAGHAHDIMAEASEEDLKALDGVIVVGGDGLFNEVLNGLVMSRHEGHAAPKPERVAEILAKAAKVDKKLRKSSRNGHEGSRAESGMNTKHDPPSGPSFDVHAPLLERSRDPTVDISRPMSSSFASPSSNSSHEGPFESVQQQAVKTVLAESSPDSAHGQEIELSRVDSVDLRSARKGSQKEGIKKEEENFMYPVAAEGVKNNSLGEGRSGLAALVRHKSLRETNVELRIGLIPAGSTDTVAISTTGSRDPITAALHILLGDSMPLDIVRITSWKKSPESGDEPPRVRYAASFAGYGFYGDVMRESETTRWMGPARYDIAGFKVFMKHKTYEAEVSFLEMPIISSSSSHLDAPRQRKIICRANCFVCDKGIDLNHLANDEREGDEDADVLQPPKPRWRTTRDTFHSVGAAVMSCRNDKAPDGMAAHAHLADGLLHLILIRSCSRPNYLRQLINLTRRGADPFDFKFVEHYKTPVFTFTSHGEESVWNVDGELFPAHELSAQCFRGLINVFARGPEV